MKPIDGQVYINLASRWAVFESLPTPLPTSEQGLPELETDEKRRTLCSIREADIERVELGDDAPHLVLFLKGGKVFFLNGYHDKYETWQCGVSMGNRSESWLVVSCPGGGLAVWVPKNFRAAWPTV